jgi:hypothetical protein
MGFIDRPDYGQTPSLRFLENHSAVLFVTNGPDNKYLWANGDVAAPAIPTAANTSDGIEDLVRISSSSEQLSDRISITHSVMSDGVQFALNYSGSAWADLTPFSATIDCAYVANFVGTGPIEVGNSSAVDTVYGTYINVNIVPLIMAEINSVTTTLANDTDTEIIVTFKRQIKASSQPLSATLTGWYGTLNGTTFLYDGTGQYYTGVKFVGHWLEDPGTPMPATHSITIRITEPNASYYDGESVVTGPLTHIEATKLITVTGVSRAIAIAHTSWNRTFFGAPGSQPVGGIGGTIVPATPYLLRSSYTPRVTGAATYAEVLSGGVGIDFSVAVGFIPKNQISYVDLVLRLANGQTYALGNLTWLRSGTYQFDGPSGPSYPAEFYGFAVGSSPTVSKNMLSVLPPAMIAPSALTSASPAIAATLISRVHTNASGATPVASTNPTAQFNILPLGGDTYISMKAAFASAIRSSSIAARDAKFTVRIAPSSWVKRVRVLFNVGGTWIEYGTTDATALHTINKVVNTDNYIVGWSSGLPNYYGVHSCMLEVTDLNDVVAYVGPMDMTIAGPVATSCCFKSGTLIKTPSGDVPIEDIKVGSEIITIDVETGQLQLSSVTSTLSKLRGGLHRLKFEKKEDLLVTEDHALYTPDKPEKWSAIDDVTSQEVYGNGIGTQIQRLLVGDNLFESTGSLRTIKDITPEEGEHAVHTFSLATTDTPWYFAGGVLAHNINSDNCCFPAGTPVSMADGSFKAIETLDAGDEVLSYDVAAQSQTSSRVGKLGVFIRDNMCTLTFEGGKILKVTDDHPLYTKGGWKSINPHNTLKAYGTEASELAVGDEILTDANTWLRVASFSIERGEFTTYSAVDVEPYHNFYADGILAHNRGGDTLPTTDCGGACCFLAGTPISTPDGYRPIEEVEAGDVVFTYDFVTGESVPATVESTLVKMRSGLYRVDYGQEEPLYVTNDHAMFNGTDWVAIDPVASQVVYGNQYGFDVKPLNVGDTLFGPAGSIYTVEDITPEEGEFLVYTFKLEGKNPWYFAGNVLAHNKCCFRGDTLISTPSGDRFMQDMKVGDWVISYDENRKLTVQSQLVAKVVVNRSYHFKVSAEGIADMFITGDHPIHRADGNWAAVEPTAAQTSYGIIYGLLVQQLSVGDMIEGLAGFHKVTSIERVPGIQTMYTFDVRDPFNIYYANGVMVHNTTSGGCREGCGSSYCCVMPGTQISTVGGFMSIENIEVGTMVLSYNRETHLIEQVPVLSTLNKSRESHYKVKMLDGSELLLTNDHAIAAMDGRWLAVSAADAMAAAYGQRYGLNVEDLAVGDVLVGADKVVASIEEIPGEVTVYTMTVGGTCHAYFANGVLVHHV